MGEGVHITEGSFHSRFFIKVWNFSLESPDGQKDLMKVKMHAVAHTRRHMF